MNLVNSRIYVVFVIIWTARRSCRIRINHRRWINCISTTWLRGPYKLNQILRRQNYETDYSYSTRSMGIKYVISPDEIHRRA